MFIGGFLSFIFLIWMVAKVWKQSPGLAFAGLVFWPTLIYALFHFWGDEESDIKVPFVLFIAAVAYFWYDLSQVVQSVKEEEALLGIARLLA